MSKSRIQNLIYEIKLKGKTSTSGFHLNYENGNYRQEELGKIIRDVVKEFALTEDEITKFKDSEDWGEMDRKAWTRISDAHKNSKGDYGEILLYIILKYFYDIPKFTTKVRLRSSTGEQVKGFDCAHYLKNGDTIELWLGEGKLREDFSSCLSDAITSIETLTQFHKVAGEFSILSSNIELQPGSESREKIEEVIAQGKSLDDVKLYIPVMLAYSWDQAKDFSEVCENFKKKIDEHFEKKMSLIDSKNINHGIKCEVFIYLLPIQSVAALKTQLDKIEEAHR